MLTGSTSLMALNISGSTRLCARIVAEDEVMSCEGESAVLLMATSMQAHVFQPRLLRSVGGSGHRELGVIACVPAGLR